MKVFHRAVSWMLAALLALPLMLMPLCASAEMGGYVEKELTMPEGYGQFTNPAALPGGGFVVAAVRMETGAWELLSFDSIDAAPVISPLDASLGGISSISVAPDGGLMAVVSGLPALAGAPAGEGENKQRVIKGPDDMTTTIVWYGEGGTIDAHFTMQGMPLRAVALSGQRLAAQGMGAGVSLYDAAGKTLQSIDNNDIVSMAAGPESLYLMQSDKISQVDLSGNTLRSIPWMMDYSEQWAVAPDGTLSMTNTSGIYALRPDGTEMERLADSTRYMIGAPDSGLSSLCALADGTLLAYLGGGSVTYGGRTTTTRIATFGGDENTKLVAYVYDSQLDTSAGIDFTVTALRDSAKLRKAVSDFQRAHPELTVHLNTSLAQDDADTPVEDVIRTLNTDLLAGKGGDVLILDELPLRQYIQKGVLMPLDAVLSDIEFLPGILQGSRWSDGNLYAMPAQFQFDTLWGSKDKVAAVESLASLAELPLDQAQDLFRARTPEELHEMFYPACQEAFLDESGKPRFDTSEFEAYLEALYSIYSSQAALPDTSFAADSGRIRSEELQGMMNGSIAMMETEISGTMPVALPYTLAGEENGGFCLVPSLSAAGRTYTPALMAGINANTQHAELAGEFVRSLYSPEIQGLDQGEGLPTVASSLDQMIEEAKARNQEKNLMMVVSTGSGNPIQMQQPDNETWDALRAACDTLTNPYIEDPTLMGFLGEETASFFAGQSTARDAALALQQRAAAYLNE